MAAKTRIYEVLRVSEGSKTVSFLVEAKSQTAAWNHVASKTTGDVSIPGGKRIAELMKSGVEVEEAK